jgi:hypothetical protein
MSDTALALKKADRKYKQAETSLPWDASVILALEYHENGKSLEDSLAVANEFASV